MIISKRTLEKMNKSIRGAMFDEDENIVVEVALDAFVGWATPEDWDELLAARQRDILLKDDKAS